jgi:hypothetical protein
MGLPPEPEDVGDYVELLEKTFAEFAEFLEHCGGFKIW